MPLSERGMLQSKVTGFYLREYLIQNRYSFDKVIIECGPSLACMMTAAHIAPSFKCKNITINHLSAGQLKTNLNQLEFIKNDSDFEQMKTSNELYQTKKYFPKGTTFTESGQTFTNTTSGETTLEYQQRGIELIETINLKLKTESTNTSN